MLIPKRLLEQVSKNLFLTNPDAWYHVMNRGRRSEVIFSRKEDHYVFMDLLKEVVDKYNVKIGGRGDLSVT
jgi:hypothetical protein